MPWKGVTVSEQRQRFLEDCLLNYYSVTDLAERFGISRNTAYRWINRFKQHGQAGFHELSRRPHTCPWQTDEATFRSSYILVIFAAVKTAPTFGKVGPSTELRTGLRRLVQRPRRWSSHSQLQF